MEIDKHWLIPEKNKDKTKTKTKHQKLKTSKIHGPHEESGGRLGCSDRESNICFLQDTRHVAYVELGDNINSSNSLMVLALYERPTEI